MKLGKRKTKQKLKILMRNEAKRSEKLVSLFALEHAKTKRNGSCIASFRFVAKKNCLSETGAPYSSDLSYSTYPLTRQKTTEKLS
jgi:hypothetical protein